MGWYLTPPKSKAKPDQMETIKALCQICNKPIGYETKFYFLPSGYSHALCEWLAQEKREANK